MMSDDIQIYPIYSKILFCGVCYTYSFLYFEPLPSHFNDFNFPADLQELFAMPGWGDSLWKVGPHCSVRRFNWARLLRGLWKRWAWLGFYSKGAGGFF